MREPKIISEYYGKFCSIPTFQCEACFGSMGNWIEDDDQCICPECALKKGIIDDQEYLKTEFYWASYKTARVKIADGIVHVAFDNDKFPWEKTNRDYRKSKEYIEWRKEVYERDGFRCQECGQVGRKLNAHHIKPFKDYPELRFNVDNGITLCEECHRSLHKRMREKKK